MSQPLLQLERLLSRLKVGGLLTEDLVVSLFVATRRLLEREQSQADYPVISFYSNWCVHATIERTLTKEWLQKISGVIGDDSSPLWYTDRILLTLSIDKLRAEFIDLFRRKKLDLFLFESLQNWVATLFRLFEHLIEIPLQRRDLVPPDSKHRFWVTKLWVVLNDKPAAHEEAKGIKFPRLEIKMDVNYNDVDGLYPQTPKVGSVQVIVPMALPEKPEAFVRP